MPKQLEISDLYRTLYVRESHDKVHWNPSSKWEFLKVSIHLRSAGLFGKLDLYPYILIISILIWFHKNIASNLCTYWCPLGAPNSEYYEPPLRSTFLRFCFILWSAGSLSWFTLDSSIREGCKVSASSWTFAFQCDINRMCKSLSSLKKFSWVITTVFTVCYAFLFRASATIFSVLGWQWMCPNWCFM